MLKKQKNNFYKNTLRNYINQDIFNDYINELQLEGFNLIFVIYERISLASFGLHLFSGIKKMVFGTVALLTLNSGPLLNELKEIMQSIESLWGHYTDFKFEYNEYIEEFKKIVSIK